MEGEAPFNHHTHVYHDRRKLMERHESRSPVPTEYDFG